MWFTARQLIMITCDINSANDIYVVKKRPGKDSGELRTTLAMASGDRCKGIVIESITRTQKGELQFQPTRGIDYMGTVFENRRYAPVCASQIRKAVSSIPWVESVDNLTYSFEEDGMKWSMDITTITGETLAVSGDGVEKREEGDYMGISWHDIIEKPDWASGNAIQSLTDRIDALTNDMTIEDLKKSDTLAAVKKAVNGLLERIRDAEKKGSEL